MTLDDLEGRIEPLRRYITAPIEFPEPALKLDLEGRAGDERRQFKHLHQMCLNHALNLSRALQIKVVALTDGYLDTARAHNPIGPYLFARALLELSAFIFDVSGRLRNIHNKPDNAWRNKGEEFFALVARARFGTSDPDIRKQMIAHGVSQKLLEPLHIKHSINALSQSEKGKALAARYDSFCDFVHHNVSSHMQSSPGFRMGDSAHSAGGGAIVLMTQAPITRYEYPVPVKVQKAIKDTLGPVVEAVAVCVDSLNLFPHTPFSEELLIKFTGTPLGVTQLIPGTYPGKTQ
jgi:hypothetical protein